MEPNVIIEKVYLAVLGRSPDPAGLETYGREIREARLDLDGLFRLLLDSPEHHNRPSHGGEERKMINALVKLRTDFVVQSGPFQGMKLIDLSNRGDGDVSPKLLGTYEQEIHAALAEFAKNRYSAIVDIGCAEGYFAVGLSRMFPGTPVLAYDTDKMALEILHTLAVRNGVEGQIIPGDFCDPAELARIMTKYPRSLIIADCEGYEKTLFSDAQTNRLAAASDIIVECHDLWDDTITPTILKALSETHAVEVVQAIGRNPNVFDFLAHLTDWDRFRAVWERRGARQNWLICRARR